MEYAIKRLRTDKDKSVNKLWSDFLLSSGINPEENIDYTVGVFENDNLIATGSIFQNILKCTAVSPQFTGGKVFNMLISHLMSEIFYRGYESCYVYTKEESLNSFIHLGFKEIERVKKELIFLEKSTSGFNEYIESLRKAKKDGEKIAGIVMNANPFTKGHLHLIQTAAKENDFLHVFVLSEDMSDFPSDVRFELVKKGTSQLNNVILHQTGSYIISTKTFPSYFLKEGSDVTYIHACLDSVIFKNHIAPALNITRRYVGEEPLSPSTAIYNRAMADIFAGNPELIIIPRIEQESEVISASRVRRLLAQDMIDEIKALVPQTTYEFLLSLSGKEIQNKIRNKFHEKEV